MKTICLWNFTIIYINYLFQIRWLFFLFTNPHNFDDFTNSGVHYKLKKQLQHLPAHNWLWKIRQSFFVLLYSLLCCICGFFLFAFHFLHWTSKRRNELYFHWWRWPRNFFSCGSANAKRVKLTLQPTILSREKWNYKINTNKLICGLPCR